MDPDLPDDTCRFLKFCSFKIGEVGIVISKFMLKETFTFYIELFVEICNFLVSTIIKVFLPI